MDAYKKIARVWIFIALALAAGCSGSGEDAAMPVVVSGHVVDSRGDPVAAAAVIISGQAAEYETDENGDFSIQIDAGDYSLSISKGPDTIAVVSFSALGGQPVALGDVDPTVDYFPWYGDRDGDGFGSSDVVVNDQSQPPGYVIGYGDCDDTASSVNPGASEACNNVDDNCDGSTDEGVLSSFYQDADADGFGNQAAIAQSCSAPAGYVADDKDCDDTAALIHPGSAEACNSVDDNCNGAIDEGVTATFYADADTDGFGNWLVPVQDCSAPGGYVANSTDCDDENASIYPGATEMCNGADDNCNVQVDEGVSITFYRDADADTYGNPANSIDACTVPAGYLTDNSDCDDTEPGLNPETIWYPDGDGDTYPLDSNALMQCLAPTGSDVPDYLTAAFDCNDGDPAINPGNIEIKDNTIDDDCNPATLDGAAVYAMADLSGDWKLFGINAGDYSSDEWNGWMQGTITFDDKGQLTDFYLEYDDAVIETASDFLFMHMDAEGIVSLAGDPMFHSAISQDKDTIVATYTDPEGGVTMLILQKAATGVTLADFAGSWNSNAIVAGDSPGWLGWFRGALDIADTGVVTFSFDRSDNDQDAGYIRHELNGDGDLETHWNLRSISADRQLAIGRMNYEGGFGLEVLTKSSGAFVPGNLEGDWSFHVISAGDAPQINGWGHGMLHFDSIGVGTVNYQAWSDPASALSVGTWSVDSAGKIVSSAVQSFAGTLSPNKDTIVATFTNPSDGASLLIALRRDPSPFGIVSEELGSASATISPAAGGSLQATAGDGTVFTLTIPPDAVDSVQDIQVKMTPLAGLSGLPISGNYLGAVQLAPEGLQLSSPATLTVDLLSAVPVTDLLAYAYQGSGSRFFFSPVLPGAGATSIATFDIPIRHFSGAGGGTGNSGDAGSVPLDPAAAGGFYESLITRAIMEEGIGARVELIIRDWFDSWVWGLVSLANTVDEVERAVREFSRWNNARQFLGITATVYPNAFSMVDDKITSTITNTLWDLDLACAFDAAPPGLPPSPEYTDPCGFGTQLLHEAKQWYALSDALSQQGLSPSFRIADIGEFCFGIAEKLASGAQIRPRGRILLPTQTGEFLAVLIDSTGLELPEHDSVLAPVWASSNLAAASVSGDPRLGQAYYATVTGESPGGTIISASDPLGCTSAQAFVTVDASGPYKIDIESRAVDNCHYDEPPDRRPIPDVLVPRSAGLIFTPVSADPEGRFSLAWSKADGGMYMGGTSTNSTEVKISGVADDSLRAGHLLKFQQSCELIVGHLELDGKCEFTKVEGWDLTLPSDICKGEYRIKGSRITN